MDSDRASALWYRGSKRQGKVRRRVQDLRIPSCSYHDFIANRPTLDLSHNESTRLAADSLLSRGLEGYQEVLNAEGEVDFLSQLEKNYILENGRDGSTADPGSCEDDEVETLSAGSLSATRCPAMSTDSDATTVVGWDLSGQKDVKRTDRVRDEPRLEIYFQSDSKAAGMKDMVREFLRKATMAVAIVTDSFSDVELLCDLLEASGKRDVSVHLLLDHLNLNLFVSMWQDLKLNSKNFPKLSVRSVNGQTYCAKTGEKLTGQLAESFIITDWAEVLSGSYSFSWLSWQVHRSIAVLLRGSMAVRFHEEFHRLLSSSKPVPGFVTHPQQPPLHAAQNTSADVSKMKSNPKSSELKCSKRNIKPLHRADTGMQMHEKPPQLYPKALVEPGPLQSASVGKPKHAVGAGCTQDGAQTNVKPLEKNQTQIQSHSDPLDQTHVSHIQSQLNSLTVNAPAEKNVRIQESKPLHAASPTHGQHRTVCYQPPFKTNSNLEHHNVVTEGPLFQQMNRDRLIKPLPIAEGLSRQRRQWYCSLNFKAKEANTGLQFGVTHPRGHISGLQTRKQDQPQRHHQSAEAPGSKSALMVRAAHLQPQLQSHSNLYLQPPPRLTWMPQGHPAITRPAAHHSSFSATYGTGQQAGWRPCHNSMSTSLGRSKSMSDRHSAGYKGAGLNPNITKT